MIQCPNNLQMSVPHDAVISTHIGFVRTLAFWLIRSIDGEVSSIYVGIALVSARISR